MREMWRTPAGRGFIMLAAMAAAFGFAQSAHGSIVTNYLDHVLHLSGPQFGYWTAIRELGGLTLIVLTALLYRVSLQRVTAGALVVVGVGYALFSIADSFWSVVPWTVISSLGAHTVIQNQAALGMSLTTQERCGWILGRVSAVGQMGTLAALVMVFVTFHFSLISYRATYIIVGVVACLGALAIVRFPHLYEGQPRQVALKREAIVLRRDYRYFYALVFLDGARQQIFFSFGLWVLVNHFGLGVSQVSLVLMTVTLGCMTTVARLGRMIDRYGERRSLSVLNLAFIVAITGYALAPNVWLACVFYFIYAIITPVAGIGSSTYLRKIALPEDLAPSLAMGQTIMHTTAIAVPVAAGFILNFVSYRVPFLAACAFALAASVITLRLDPVKQRCAAGGKAGTEATPPAPGIAQ
jgi:predicted MFS family arabinose efflux permease